jgi:hypothetical protein
MQQLALFGAPGVGRLYLFFLIVLAALLLDGLWVWLLWSLLTLIASGIAFGVAAGLIQPSVATIVQVTQPAQLPAQVL